MKSETESDSQIGLSAEMLVDIGDTALFVVERGTLIYQHELELIGQRVEIVTPHVVVRARSPMQTDQRQPGSPLHHKKSGITDVYELPR